ncbi:hypothetical protein M4J06_000599 [Streptomyces coelicoflavus]|uniref:hypothetical protein n=1 Tax=Streptomyces coelicoflavus TaxID=285562 RepID=UPI00210C5704|nr:hypothetical protein [Streptomyces coelicoflavus]MCQ4203216.1 hypothetical protein [Streptomyces coelicoflavus]
MSELTGLTIFLFVLAVLLVVMACIKADRVRSWREVLNPSAPDLPDAAFVVGRAVLILMAIACVVVGFQGLAVQDDGEWSDDELTSAAEDATQALDGSCTYGDPLTDGAPADFDGEYARKVEQEVVHRSARRCPTRASTTLQPTGRTWSSAWTSSVRTTGTSKPWCPDSLATRRW